MENIGLWPVCNAIIDEVKNKASITRKSRLLILKQGPRRRADLLSERKAKSLDENLDEEAARDAEEVLLPFLVRTDSTTLLFIDFSLASPLGPVNSLHVVGVRGEFVRQIFVNGVLLAPSSLDCLLNGRAILLGKSLSRDSITLVRLSVKETIDSETADCILYILLDIRVSLDMSIKISAVRSLADICFLHVLYFGILIVLYN